MTVSLQNKIHPGELVSPDKILIASGAPSKRELVARLVHLACQGAPRLDEQDVLAQVLKREEGFGTALETGLAIPHARLEELDAFSAAMAVLPEPMSDDPLPQTPTRVMFLFLSPGCPAFFKQHLQLLASLAETFQPALVEELAGLKEPGLIVQRLARPNMVK